MAGKKNNKPGQKVISLEKQGEQKPRKTRAKKPKKAFTYPGRGAPKIYATAAELAKGCERYFASISLVEIRRNPVTGKPELNSLGKEVEEVLWLKQPSMGGLARSLGITDRTLRNYEQDKNLAPVVEWAKGICRDWLLEEATTREKGSLNGLIFVLENNYGMKERSEVEVKSKTIEEFLMEQGGAGEF